MLETLDRFLVEWVVAGEQHYENVKQKYIEFIKTGADKDAYKNAEKTKALFGSKQLAWDAGRLIRNAYYCNDLICEEYTVFMKKVLLREAANKKAALEARIRKEVAEIVKVDLMIGIDGSLNGYVQGTAGKVTITTIGAGGYNIQRYHYRVLVKRVKE